MIITFKNCQFDVLEAITFKTRLKGLLGTDHLPKDNGLLLMYCSAIHCCFMKYTIDVVYLDEEYRVLAKETVAPWQLGKIVKNAKHVLELAEGCAEPIEIGEKMCILG